MYNYDVKFSEDEKLNQVYREGNWRQHICILAPGWAHKILGFGKKIESRFNKIRCAPFRKVNEGDTVFIKESSNPKIEGLFTAGKVTYYENVTEEQIRQIYKDHREDILCDYWVPTPMPEEWLEAKHVSLIGIENAASFSQTMYYNNPKNRSGWITLNDKPIII